MKILPRIIGAVLLFATTVASAVNVTYKVNDLTDVNAGEDLWEYRYKFTGPFNEFDVVEIAFDSANYGSLETDGDVGDWLVSLFQPDPSLPADGLFEALATVSPISVADEFVVRFVWLAGPATPGAQSYRVLDGDLNEVASGRTRVATTQVPEPGSLMLMMAAAAGLLGAAAGRKVL